MINYILANNHYLEKYLQYYTNSPYLVNPDFKMPGELDGTLPGYLPVPRADQPDLATYLDKTVSKKHMDPRSANWKQNQNKYVVSYLKAIYGAKATKENDFGYGLLPKLDPGMNCSWQMIFDKLPLERCGQAARYPRFLGKYRGDAAPLCDHRAKKN